MKTLIRVLTDLIRRRLQEHFLREDIRWALTLKNSRDK
jgi:hypothetical protein